MIEKLIAKSRTTEVADASVRMIVAFGQWNFETDAHLTAIFNDLGSKTEWLTAAIHRAKTESELELKDEVRDDNLRSLYYLITGFTHHPDAVIKAAAVKLAKLFDNYGLKITDESYASESALISSLLMDLGNEEYQEAITALSGCAALIQALQNSQEDFEITRVTWEREKAKEGALENATELKKEVVAIINERLVVYLQAMKQVNPEMYEEFTNTIAVIIAENNETVKRRAKKPEPVTATEGQE
jgi:hypothetical protein